MSDANTEAETTTVDTTAQADTPSATDEGGLLTGEEQQDTATDEGGLLTGDKTDEASGDADTTEDSKDEAEGAPESYEDFTMPEGMELDGELTEELKTFAKEANLSQAKAQGLVDMGAKLVDKWVDNFADRLVEQRNGWLEASKAEFDDAALAQARKGLEAFGTPELKKFMREEGVENHPEIVRLLARVGELASEDRFVAGDKAQTSEKPLANRMFPTAN